MSTIGIYLPSLVLIPRRKTTPPGFEHVTCRTTAGAKHHYTKHVTPRPLEVLCNDPTMSFHGRLCWLGTDVVFNVSRMLFHGRLCWLGTDVVFNVSRMFRDDFIRTCVLSSYGRFLGRTTTDVILQFLRTLFLTLYGCYYSLLTDVLDKSHGLGVFTSTRRLEDENIYFEARWWVYLSNSSLTHLQTEELRGVFWRRELHRHTTNFLSRQVVLDIVGGSITLATINPTHRLEWDHLYGRGVLADSLRVSWGGSYVRLP